MSYKLFQDIDSYSVEDKKPNIHIDPENEGSFTAWCKKQGFDGVTDECIKKGKQSKNKKIRKKAIFAENARKWKHKKKKK